MTEVLVVGAGPTGLAVAAFLHAGRRSVPVRMVHPGVDDTAYPFLLAIPQRTVEETIEEHLEQQGIAVEHGVTLLTLDQDREVVRCSVDTSGGRRQIEADWVVGCDGADSTVRRQVGIPFPSRPYRATLLLADLEIEAELEHPAFHGYVGDPGILFLFPSTCDSTWRLLTVQPGGVSRSGEPPDLATLQAVADLFTGGTLPLGEPTWATRIRLRRGHASRYRSGRVLLAGDAAHVHSPAGAQGMNTGIQDAANLGWKLAHVVRGEADVSLLDSYEAERWPVARRVRHAPVVEKPGHARLGVPASCWADDQLSRQPDRR